MDSRRKESRSHHPLSLDERKRSVFSRKNFYDDLLGIRSVDWVSLGLTHSEFYRKKGCKELDKDGKASMMLTMNMIHDQEFHHECHPGSVIFLCFFIITWLEVNREAEQNRGRMKKMSKEEEISWNLWREKMLWIWYRRRRLSFSLSLKSPECDNLILTDRDQSEREKMRIQVALLDDVESGE